MSLNIDLTKVNEKTVDHYLHAYNITAKGGLNAKVNALEKHQRKTTDGGSVDPANISTPCTVCGGISDVTLPECPYCGAKDTEDIPTEAKPTNGAGHEDIPELSLATEAADDEPESESGDDDIRAGSQDDVGSHHDQDPPEVTGEHAVGNAQPAVESDQPPVDEPPPEDAQERTMKTTTQKLTKVKRKNTDSVVETTGREIAAPADKLDAAVKRVHEALSAGAMSYWELGKALVDIFDDQLWKQRTDGTGRQKYPSWNVFLRDELHMSAPNAFSVMDAARHFSKKDFELIGHTKLSMMLRLPEERRTKLFEEAKAGKLSRARIKEIIADEVPKGTVRDTGRKSHAADPEQHKKKTAKAAEANRERAAARRVLPKAEGGVTAVYEVGRSKLKLFARPNVKKPTEKPARAVSVSQDPWCEETLVNGVVVRFTIIKTPTGLELHREIRRPE